ncbi:MAG: hypothetical protein WAU21_03870, partial [Chitinophagales bacterium]
MKNNLLFKLSLPVIICSILFSIGSISAQNTFRKTYDLDPIFGFETTSIHDVIQNIDSGYFYYGGSFSAEDGSHQFIAKTDKFGDLLWIDSVAYPYKVATIQACSDGNIGVVYYSLYVDSTRIKKFSLTGSIISDISLANPEEDYYMSGAFVFTDDGGYILPVMLAYDLTYAYPDREIVLEKYSSAGSLEWTYEFSVDSAFMPLCYIVQTEDGYLISSAHRFSYFDASENLVESFYSSLRKINMDGELVFFEEIADLTIRKIEVLDDGSYLYLFADNHDYPTYDDTYQGWILQKRSATGDIIWQQEYPEYYNYELKNIMEKNDGSIAIAMYGPLDFTYWSEGDLNLFTFDEDGNFINEKFINSNTDNFSLFTTISTSDNGYLFAGGSTHYTPDAFLMKGDSLGNSDRVEIVGKVFYDANNNLIYDDGDVDLPDQLVSIIDEGIYTATNSQGVFTTFAYTPGDYNIYTAQPDLFYQTSPLSDYYSIYVDSIAMILDTLYFAKNSDEIYSDLTLQVDGGVAKLGFNSFYSATIKNEGILTAGDVVLTLYFDSAFTLESSTPSAATYSGDIGTWEISNLNALESFNINLFIITDNDTSLIGDEVMLHGVVVNSTSESTLENNVDTLTLIAAASFDPNHKSAIPAGETDLGYVDPATSHLEYKIEFQNLGNDSATFIVVYDTLSSEILFESFHMLSASHNYTLDFIYPNIVKWTFNNINLPYSFIDEPGSQGFVKFEVDLQPGLPVGTQIKNNAAIYFDYNPAVITNTAYTTLQLYIPDFIADDQLFQKVIVYPNPSDNQISF